MDAELFSANNLKKITDLIGKKLPFGTSIFIRQIPLIAQFGRAEDCSVRSQFDSNP